MDPTDPNQTSILWWSLLNKEQLNLWNLHRGEYDYFSTGIIYNWCPTLKRIFNGLLSNDYLPECERVGPHIAQVGQGVEEGHVGASDGGVRDPGKESHDGEEPGSMI